MLQVMGPWKLLALVMAGLELHRVRLILGRLSVTFCKIPNFRVKCKLVL